MSSPWRHVTAFASRKIGAAALTLWALSLLVFVMVKLIPGDEAHVAAGETASADQVEAVRHRLDLDRPVFEQYLAFVGRALHGDLGTSTASHQPIGAAIAQVLPQTIELVVLAMTIMVSVVVPLAV